jgi:protein SCO1/2
MTRLLMLLAVTLVVGVALMVDEVAKTPVLPFYDSGDFTPRWTTSVAHRIEDFSLTTQTGAPLRRADLLGRVHVATFIYTRCAGVCPAMVSQLSKVQEAIAGATDALIVSYTVTPSVDTPQVLSAFGNERHIDPAAWKLVTGDADQIYGLARRSYFADDGRLDAATPAAEQFLHTEKALLVDREGRLRGVYNATLPHEIDKLIGDLGLLTKRVGAS